MLIEFTDAQIDTIRQYKDMVDGKNFNLVTVPEITKAQRDIAGMMMLKLEVEDSYKRATSK